MTMMDGGYGRADPATGELTRGSSLLNEAMRYTTVDTQLHGQWEAAGTTHKLLIGAEWLRSEFDFQAASSTAPSLNVNNPVYGVGVSRPTLTDRYSDARGSQTQLGIYAQDQIKFGSQWMLTLGGRYDKVKSRSDDRIAAQHTETPDSAFTGRVGLTYLSAIGLAPYLSYAQSFLPTAGVDSQGDPFKPTRGRQVELGIKYQSADARTLVTAAMYDLTKRNVVTYDPVSYEAQQVGEMRSRGLEIEIKASLARGIDLTGHYTLTDIENTKDSNSGLVGKRPALIPKHTAAAWVDYAVSGSRANGLGVGIGVRYVGSRYGDGRNTRLNPGVTLFDPSVHYTQGPWRLALNVQNLFDKDNGVYGYGVYYQGIKRAVTATVRHSF